MQYSKLIENDTELCNKIEEYLFKLQEVGFVVIYQEPFVFVPDYGEDRTPQNEELYCLFNYELGILIEFDTFWGNVNSSKMYYNWSPDSYKDTRETTSSGQFLWEDNNQITLFESDLKTRYYIPGYPDDVNWIQGESWDSYRQRKKPVDELRNSLVNKALKDGKRMLWVGDHDGRRGVKTIITNMQKHGRFLQAWVKCPFPWITNYAEHKNTSMSDFTILYNVTKERISKFPQQVQKQIGEYKN